MKLENLIEEIDIEFESLEIIVAELLKLTHDVGDKNPNIRDLTAASAFLAQFYNGVENILKRFYRFLNKPLPKGADWHITLFRSFCDPPEEKLPLLFSKQLDDKLSSFRKFRHVVHHGYGFKLDWVILKPGIDGINDIFQDFKTVIRKAMGDLKAQKQ
jgi:hypothetical protein